jgi:hypothetical protein
MSPRNLLNLAMAGIAIGLGLAAWFRPGLEPSAAPQPITLLNPAEVNHIQISREQYPSLTFTRQDGDWQLDGNPPLPASPFQVHALLAILQTRTTRHYPADNLDLREAGLDPPQATMILDDTTTLRIGNTEPLDNLRYIQCGATVYLVEDRYQPLINADRTNFIDRRLLADGAVITRLVLPDLVLARRADGDWKVTPDDAAVSTDAIQQLLANWQHTSALYIRPHEQGTAGTKISLELAGSDTPIVFELVARTPEFVLARPDLGIQYHFSKGTGEHLLGFELSAVTVPSKASVSH